MHSKITRDSMPARRRTAVRMGPIPDNDDNKDVEAYRLKRKRNNDAVKRTREKSKQTALERKQNVDKLRLSNNQLEAKIEEAKRNVEKLKEILLLKVNPEQHYQTIQSILAESTDEDNTE